MDAAPPVPPAGPEPLRGWVGAASLAVWSDAEALLRAAGDTVVDAERRTGAAEDVFDVETVSIPLAALIHRTFAAESPGPGPYLSSTPISALGALQAFVETPLHLVDALATVFWSRDHITPCHAHPLHEALLLQVVGTKELLLFPPEDRPNLHPWPLSTFAFAQSRVPVFDSDASRFPGYSATHPIRMTLAPGDALRIPVGWWHATRTAGPTIALSWFREAPVAARLRAGGLRDLVGAELHMRGHRGRRLLLPALRAVEWARQ